jgi:type IV pilus assembly protein PilV
MTKTFSRQGGSSLFEVLVSMIILAIGLLGAANLQSRLQVNDLESYQRSQALILLNDMANRIKANSNNAANYVTGSGNPLGGTNACPAAGGTLQTADSREWCLALQGAAEALSGNNVGAMIGGRGCVEDLGNKTFMITVAWQGMAPLNAPAASVACGQNDYDDVSTPCVSDMCRRTVTSVVRVATL